MSKYALYVNDQMDYPDSGNLFRPASAYPEYPFEKTSISPRSNSVYDGIRELLRLYGLDEERFGTPEWNPLGAYVKPGMTVLVKPNLVMHMNPTGNGTECLYSHPSVIAAVIDYVCIALNSCGRIVVADAPMQSCDFDVLVRESGLRELVEWYSTRGIDIELKDMRGLKSVVNHSGLKQSLVEGARGKVIDLGRASSFYGLPEERINGLRITNYDPSELKKHHTMTRHEYYVSSDLLDADFVINLPKAKTHRKAGVTGALKNMVGINVRKEYLPHHCNGAKSDGFDEYEKRSKLKAISGRLLDTRNTMLASGGGFTRKALSVFVRGFRFLGKNTTGDEYSEGSWFGNDTIWRTVLDLNKIVFHADKDGVLRDDVQRGMLVICDMVTIGQGEGPLLPEPGEWHMLALCDDPTTHDVAMSRMLGTDASIIPTVEHALSYSGPYSWSTSDAFMSECVSNDKRFDGVCVSGLNGDLRYCAKPTTGWAACFKRGV